MSRFIRVRDYVQAEPATRSTRKASYNLLFYSMAGFSETFSFRATILMASLPNSRKILPVIQISEVFESYKLLYLYNT